MASVGGAQVEYRCTPVPESAERFYAEAVYSNSDIVRAPDLPDYTMPLPGLEARSAGISNGTGRGDPIGDFTFQAHWSGYQPGFVVAATNDVFTTQSGELHADELFTGGSASDLPNMRFDGAFTFTGGTGAYQKATGSAQAVARQLGDGVRTAFVACGWIAGIDHRY